MERVTLRDIFICVFTKSNDLISPLDVFMFFFCFVFFMYQCTHSELTLCQGQSTHSTHDRPMTTVTYERRLNMTFSTEQILNKVTVTHVDGSLVITR